MSEVIQFHNLSHIFISLIGATLLLAIYFNIRKRFKKILEEDESQTRVDKGLLNLGFAMLVWVCSGIWELLGGHYNFADGFIFQVGVNLFSIVNNLFLLLALTYFYHAPDFISNNKKNVKLIMGIIVLTTIATLLISQFAGNFLMYGTKVVGLPDLILSGFICFLLLVSLYKTFSHYGLKVVAIISVVIVVLMFISQLPGVFVRLDDDFFYSLIRIIAKSSLISLFLLLATTWVIQLANTPKIDEMQIRFLDWSQISLTIPSKNIIKQPVDFGSKTTQYKNLLKLAIRRKYGTGDDQSILVNTSGEIKNQTYLSRIIENINQISKLDGENQLDRRDLFTFLGESKYRLRILPDQIEIDDALLHEFVKNSENKAYSAICNQL